MEFWTVTLISLVAGLVLVIGGALVMYMGSLVKSAYQLKIEIKAEMDEGQKKIQDDVDKKLRWIKRELIEEIDKIKVGLLADHQRRLTETTAILDQRLAEATAEWRNDRAATISALGALQRDVAVLDQRQRSLRREQAAKAEVSAAAPAAATEPPPATSLDCPLAVPPAEGMPTSASPSRPAD